MSSLQTLPPSGLPAGSQFMLLQNTLFINEPLPTAAPALLERFFQDFDAPVLVSLLQNVTFAAAESSWFGSLEAIQRNEVLWELRQLEELIGLLGILTPNQALLTRSSA